MSPAPTKTAVLSGRRKVISRMHAAHNKCSNTAGSDRTPARGNWWLADDLFSHVWRVPWGRQARGVDTTLGRQTSERAPTRAPRTRAGRFASPGGTFFGRVVRSRHAMAGRPPFRRNPSGIRTLRRAGAPCCRFGTAMTCLADPALEAGYALHESSEALFQPFQSSLTGHVYRASSSVAVRPGLAGVTRRRGWEWNATYLVRIPLTPAAAPNMAVTEPPC